jgi:hypothetical protein
MSVPQQLSYVTIGARSMTALRAFYGYLADPEGNRWEIAWTPFA